MAIQTHTLAAYLLNRSAARPFRITHSRSPEAQSAKPGSHRHGELWIAERGKWFSEQYRREPAKGYSMQSVEPLHDREVD